MKWERKKYLSGVLFHMVLEMCKKLLKNKKTCKKRQKSHWHSWNVNLEKGKKNKPDPMESNLRVLDVVSEYRNFGSGEGEWSLLNII